MSLTSGVQRLADDPELAAVDVVIRRHHRRQDALLEVLHAVQRVYGHLPRKALWHVARSLKLPPSRVYGVATFYHLFSLEPKGRHRCIVCTGTTCHVKGSQQLLAGLVGRLRIRDGQTSPDGSVTLQTARCVGACGLAPVILFDGELAGHQSEATALKRVQEWSSAAE